MISTEKMKSKKGIITFEDNIRKILCDINIMLIGQI